MLGFRRQAILGVAPATAGVWGRREPPHQAVCAPARLLFFLGFAGGFAFDILAAASFGEFFKEG